MHFKTGLFYYFQDPPRQYKSGIVTMVWLTSTFHTVIHSVALNCGAEDNMGWRVATQVQLRETWTWTLGTPGSWWDTKQPSNHHLGGHNCHLVYCVTSAPGGGGTSCNVSFLIHFPQILIKLISSRGGNAIFNHLCFTCDLCCSSMLLCVQSLSIVQSHIMCAITYVTHVQAQIMFFCLKSDLAKRGRARLI